MLPRTLALLLLAAFAATPAAPPEGQAPPSVCAPEAGACVLVRLREKLGDLLLPDGAIGAMAHVQVERGRLAARSEGIQASTTVFVVRANGLPDPEDLNQQLGPLTVAYTKLRDEWPEPLVLGGPCACRKVGEAWVARVEVHAAGEMLASFPAPAAVLEDPPAAPGGRGASGHGA